MSSKIDFSQYSLKRSPKTSFRNLVHPTIWSGTKWNLIRKFSSFSGNSGEKDYFWLLMSVLRRLTLPGLGFFELEKTGGGQFDPRLLFSTKKVIWSPFLVYEFLTPKWVCKTKIVNIRRRRRRHCRGEYHDVIALVKPSAAIKWP